MGDSVTIPHNLRSFNNHNLSPLRKSSRQQNSPQGGSHLIRLLFYFFCCLLPLSFLSKVGTGISAITSFSVSSSTSLSSFTSTASILRSFSFTSFLPLVIHKR